VRETHLLLCAKTHTRMVRHSSLDMARKKSSLGLAFDRALTWHGRNLLTSSCSSLILPRGFLAASSSAFKVGADSESIPRPYWLPHLRVRNLPLSLLRAVIGGDPVRLSAPRSLLMVLEVEDGKVRGGDGVRVPHTCSRECRQRTAHLFDSLGQTKRLPGSFGP
jgi:hypothetical protein